MTDTDIEQLADLLAALPPPLEPLDLAALDGYLAGVLLQPKAVPEALWLPGVTDLGGRPAPPGAALQTLHGLVRQRHAELAQAIDRRDWFDPWIFADEPGGADDTHGPQPANDAAEDGGDDESAVDAVLPWVTGFAAAMEAFPALMALDDPALVEPLALLFLHFDAADLEDADALLAVIETIEPPATLGDAVQDIVRALMLIADVTRPRARPPRPSTAGRRRTGTPRRR